MEAHGFEFLAKGGNGGSGEFVGGLFRDAEGGADFAVALAISDAFCHEPEPGGKSTHGLFQPFAGFESGGLVD